MAARPKRSLERSPERMIAGVCSGLGEYFDIDPVIVRLAFVLLTVAGGAGVIAYIALWVIMPPPDAPLVSSSGARLATGIRSMANEAADIGRDVHQSLAEEPQTGDPAVPGRREHVRRHHRGAPVLGLILVITGVWLLLGNLGVLDWASGRYVWPGVLILLGFLLVVNRWR
jgi:phage shock protein C